MLGDSPLVEPRTVVVRFGRRKPKPVVDGNGRVLGTVQCRGVWGLSVCFRGLDGSIALQVHHERLGVTIFGRDRWRVVDERGDEIGFIDERWKIWVAGTEIGVVRWEDRFGEIIDAHGCKRATLMRSLDHGWRGVVGSRAYATEWRLRLEDVVDPLRTMALACLAAYFGGHLIDERIG